MLSKYFSLNEATRSSTASRLGLNNQPDTNTLTAMKSSAMRLDSIREYLGFAIIVSSWFRSKDVNKAVGGSPTSDHMTGKSIDFTCPNFGTVYEVCEAIIKSGIKFDQLIYETNSRGSQWVHIGFGDRMRMEVLTHNPTKGMRYAKGLHK